jgi:hypothetical protein
MCFVQFEQELGPLSEEETKVSRKFVKFILEFAVKERLDLLVFGQGNIRFASFR